MTTPRLITLLALVTFSVAACGGAPSGELDLPPTETTSLAPVTTATTMKPEPPTSIPLPGSSVPPGEEEPKEPITIEDLSDTAAQIVQSAVDDLAVRLDVADEQVIVVSHESVTWSDGSIGCPQPGMNYTQALVSGTRTILSVDGVDFAYHSSDRGEPFLCERPQLPSGDLGNPDA